MILRRQTPNLDYVAIGKRNVKETLERLLEEKIRST